MVTAADTVECAKAMVVAGSLYLCNPHSTPDATAYENAQLLSRTIRANLGDSTFRISNKIQLMVDFFPDPVDPVNRYEMGFSMAIGDELLENTKVAVFGRDRMYFFPEDSVEMSIPVDGLTETISRYIRFCGGKMPWDMNDDRLKTWRDNKI